MVSLSESQASHAHCACSVGGGEGLACCRNVLPWPLWNYPYNDPPSQIPRPPPPRSHSQIPRPPLSDPTASPCMRLVQTWEGCACYLTTMVVSAGPWDQGHIAIGIGIEHFSFTLLVMSSTGGLGPASTSTYKRLATLLAAKWNQPYTSTMNWLRCRLLFSLLRSSIQAIRGGRLTAGKASKATSLPID